MNVMSDSGDIPLKHPYSKLTDLQLLEIVAVEGNRASHPSEEDPEYVKGRERVEGQTLSYISAFASVSPPGFRGGLTKTQTLTPASTNEVRYGRRS
jgi:hypothetical protein